MKIYSDYGKEERHKIECDHCQKLAYPSHKNPNIFWGFQCMDTGMFVSNDCKKDYYLAKNTGKYGIEHANKYSEMPVMVPWKNMPIIKEFETRKIRFKKSLQYQLIL